MPHWMRFVDWTLVGAMMFIWLFLIAVVGDAALPASWRQTDRHRRPKGA